MTVKGGTSQACAACKYQRRKCSADCPLAPYFPPDQPKMFQNAHRLFGVSNILKILKQLNPSQKMEAMRSIIYQSNIREKHRVHGCVGIILTLQYHIHQTELELEAVTAQLNMYRQQLHSSGSSQSQLVPLPANNNNNTLSLFQEQQQFNAMATGISFAPHQNQSTYFNGNGNNVQYNVMPPPTYSADSKENQINSAWIQPYNNNNSSNPVTQFGGAMQACPLQQREYDEMPLFFDTIDDQQSYIDCKEAYESSSESSMKDSKQPIDPVEENELKNAAACFSLTNAK